MTFTKHEQRPKTREMSDKFLAFALIYSDFYVFQLIVVKIQAIYLGHPGLYAAQYGPSPQLGLARSQPLLGLA
ncbi:MAG: hypothetical protein ACPGVJ_09425, partial [Mangrovicoccus sp.]